MKTPYSFYVLFPLLGAVAACTPPRPSSDEVVTETYVHRYGVPLPPDEWSERGQYGQVVSTQKDGVVATRSYEGGVLHGECTYSFPYRDRIQKKEVYHQGNLSQEVSYYASGVPQQQIDYASNEQRTITSWYEDGSPQFRETYENGRLNQGEYYSEGNFIESQVNEGAGRRTRRDGLGILQSVDTIERGDMVLRTTYHPNGVPAALTPYVNGRIEGTRNTYYPSGEPAAIETWTNNQQHGITTTYENGDKLSEIPYVNNQKHGVERRFKDGAGVAQEVTWEKGKKQGPCYTYTGNTTQTNWYYDDQMVNKATYDVLRSQ